MRNKRRNILSSQSSGVSVETGRASGDIERVSGLSEIGVGLGVILMRGVEVELLT